MPDDPEALAPGLAEGAEGADVAEEADGSLKPPGAWPMANCGNPANISNPQLKAITPADFALAHAMFIVLRISETGQVLDGNLYGFTLPSYRCK